MHKRIIHTVFEAQAERYPEQIAVEEEFNAITYETLNAQANSLAHILRYLRVGKDKVTGVCLSPGIALTTSLLAVWKSGGIYLPLDKAQPEKRLLKILSQTEACILIASEDMVSSIQKLLTKEEITLHAVILFDVSGKYSLYLVEHAMLRETSIPEVAGNIDNPALINEPSDSNYIFYTSGSTGEAKAILGCHDSLSHFIHWEGKVFSMDETCRVSQLSPITFDASLRDILLPLSVGGTVCVPEVSTKSNTHQLIRWVERQRISLIHCVPSLFRLLNRELLSEPGLRDSFRGVRHILMAGEPLYGKDIQLWRESDVPWVELVNLYGTSETTLVKTFHRIREVPADPSLVLHVGKPISNADVLILSGTTVCETGMIGEVYIRTPFMSKGYFKDEELTRKSFVPNPLIKDRLELMHKTGDMGRYLPGGEIEILGRLDEQVKVNGIRIELNEIKQAVLTKPGIREVVILAHKNEDMQTELLCYYVGPGITPKELRSHLQQELNAQVIPPYILAMDEFPLTINGKVDKRALPKPEFLLIDEATYRPVENTIEAKLESIWKEILGLNLIGRNAAFFQIGGTSLKAMQVISRVYREFNCSLKLGDVFQHPTIAELATIIDSSDTTDYEAIPVLPVQKYYEVSNAQKRIWLEHVMEPGKSRFNMPSAFLLWGKVDSGKLSRAFEMLVERHESLRTVFINDAGTVKQQIKLPAESGFRMELIQTMENHDARSFVEQLTAEVFDLENGPLIKVYLLVRTDSDSESVLVFNTHHIISDGWSEAVMIRELMETYASLMQGSPVTSTALPIQYKEYASWQNTQCKTPEYARQEQYWKDRLSGVLPVLQFPTDYPRSETRSGKGNVLECFLDKEQTQAIRNYAAGRGTSLFILLTTVTYILLHKYSGQEDIIVGTPIAGRTHPDLENQVGLFLNLLALRTRFGAVDSFETVLEQVKETVVSAFENQLYAFDDLVDAIQAVPEAGRAAIADVWIQWSDEEFDFGKSFAGMRIEQFDMGYSTSKVDLTFKFGQRDDRLHLAIEYCTDLFKKATIEGLRQNFIQLLEQLPKVGAEAIAKISLALSEDAESEEADFLKSIYESPVVNGQQI